ncbi:hypothetical protein, variant 1 [Aphanomyces astaci]|uniref:histone deacetylase n=1 Tax=Aphanomyces astaci TaxID=112090 RepID=W4G6G1_APHAT|nr:hypothetical protein, variant 1 [Aphanomyces astaci]ETV74523.1 hypothetical protein, variant 1 [Aphanomyces astaci]|eukprot:XP_009836181.1 hypothetical protein, variant 1 [Aphanomyces astaci]
MEATSEKRLRPILTSILTTSANTSRNSTPKSTTSSTSITVPPMKRRVSFTNLGNPELPIPDKLEDILEADLNRTPSGKPLESTSPTRVVETTDLHHACRHLDVDRAAVFLAHASSDSVNFVSVEDGYSALTLAAMAPDSHFDVSLRLAQLLTHHGASVSLPDSQGFTALHWCAAVGNASVLQHLLAMAPSSCMDLPGANGDTALHRASRFGHADCIRLLLLHGASTCALTLDMHTPLDVAGFADGSTVYEASRTAARAAFMSSRPQLKTLVLHHPDCHEHMTAASHQESPLRLAAILDPILQHPQETIHVDVSSSSFHPSGMMVVSSDFAFVSLSVVRRVHSAKYVDTLKALHHQVQSHTDGCMALTPRLQVHVQGTAVAAAKLESICDTNFSRGTLKAALRAAGSVCHAVHAVAMGKYRNAFCVVRPPGHHAGWSGLLKDSISCGFCILNNVMIGAQYALDTCPHVKKVAIVDFDAHHGNGTQDILTQHPRPNVLFISLHVFAEGFYPGSGGDHDYARNIYNFPIHPMWTHAKDKGSAAFRAKVTQVVLPLLRAFGPDLILVSAGFDGCHYDIGNKQYGQRDGPVGLDLSPGDFHWVTTQLMLMANLCCNGRLVSVLEGGYGRVRTEHDDKDDTSPDGAVAASPDGSQPGTSPEDNHATTAPLILDTLQASAHAHLQALTCQSYVEPPPVKTRTSTRTPAPTFKAARAKRKKLT